MIAIETGTEERTETELKTERQDGINRLTWQRTIEREGYVVAVTVALTSPEAVPDDVLLAECPATCAAQLLGR